MRPVRAIVVILELRSADVANIMAAPGPGPGTVLKNQKHLKIPLPKSRSPAKTNLRSPAKKNPYLPHLSSPSRGAPARGSPRPSTILGEEPPARRLDFGERNLDGVIAGSYEDDDNIDPDLGGGDIDLDTLVDNSFQMVDSMRTDPVEPDDNGWSGRPRETPKLSAKAKGKQRASPSLSDVRPSHSFTEGLDDETEHGLFVNQVNNWEPPAQSSPRISEASRTKPRPAQRQAPGSARRPQPLKNIAEEPEDEPTPRPAKRQRVVEPQPAPAQATEPPVKRGRGRPPKNGVKAQGKRPRGRPRKSTLDDDDIGEGSFMALQRGPPMPKSRGLVSVRRDVNGVQQTRSGRHSYRPLDYWRGEQVVMEDEATDDMFSSKFGFVMPTTKEVVRVPEEEAKAKSKGRPRNRQTMTEEEEPEQWEISPGTIDADAVEWQPEYEDQPPGDDDEVDVREQRLAVAADAIKTSDVKDANFKFAKTLSMPFMGAGVVDLPPGTEKRNKNSRKMQMVFFVHYGKVLVTINELEFRISAGGMWFVPRGEFS